MLFSTQEYQHRVSRAHALMEAEGLDWLLIFEPENLTYLSGFWTLGYGTSFQFLLIPLGQDPIIITRIVERFWVDQSSPFADTTIYWSDGELSGEVVARAFTQLAVSGRVGVELGSWRANVALVTEIRAAVPDVTLIDVGHGVSHLRLLKSDTELTLMRLAARISEVMTDAAVATARPGISERQFAAELARVGMEAGSDQPWPGCISSGPAAREIHANYSDRVLEPDDLLFVELAPHVDNYHARFMRSIVLGKPPVGFHDLAKRLTDVQDEALATVRAGASCRTADEIYRRGIADCSGLDSYPNKTFYGVGLLLRPNTSEPLEVNERSEFDFEAGQTFHTYLSVGGFNLSETILITATGYERLTNYSRELTTV